MKHIKLFEKENWNANAIKNIIDEYTSFIEKTQNYFNINDMFPRDEHDKNDITIEIIFYKGDKLAFNYHHRWNFAGEQESNYYCLSDKEYGDYLLYMSDPDAYISSKKYNL